MSYPSERQTPQRILRGSKWQALVRLLEALRVGGPARSAWRRFYEQRRRFRKYCRTVGLLPWQPLVPEEAFFASLKGALVRLRAADPEAAFGDYLEFGVSRGTSMAVAYRVLRAEGLDDVRLIGFDSFRGLPPEAAAEGGRPDDPFRPGDYRSSLAATRRYLKDKGVDPARVVLIEGWFKETLTPATRAHIGVSRASIVMIDCDLYSSAREALRFCAPLLGDHAVAIFDDWACLADAGMRGEKEAFEEFLAEYPDFRCEELGGYTRDARVFLVSRVGTPCGSTRSNTAPQS